MAGSAARPDQLARRVVAVVLALAFVSALFLDALVDGYSFDPAMAGLLLGAIVAIVLGDVSRMVKGGDT